MMNTYGYYRLAAATPRLRVAHVEYNVGELVKQAQDASREGAAVVVFPELAEPDLICLHDRDPLPSSLS